ncbi:MAG: long-chain fatty acid--CoA ligase [Pseudomonadota bacterium]
MNPTNPILPAAGPAPRTIFDLLAAAAAEWPSRTAALFFGARLTYAALLDNALALSHSLDGFFGIGRGSKVALMLPDCPQTVMALFALGRLGAVCVMINPTSPGPEIDYLLQDSEAEAMILLDQFLPQADAAPAFRRLRSIIVTAVAEYLPFHLAALHRFRQGRSVLPAHARHFSDLLKGGRAGASAAVANGDDLALIQYTGGTTGRPKGVMLTHANLLANVEQIGEWVGGGARRGGEILLAVLPYFHVFGLTCSLLFPVAMAATMVMLPRFDVTEVTKAVERYHATMLPAIPAMFSVLVRDPHAARHDFSSLKLCISGASALTDEAARLFATRTGVEITQGYGLTEASPVTHVNRATGARKAGSIGVPLPRTRCRIMDLESGERELPRGEIGELVVAGPQVMAGYWKLPEETARTLRGEWLHTGDVARVDAEGYYYIVDRKKEMIITAGYNVYPSEVEAAVMDLAGVREVAVVGLPDDLRGEQVAAFLVVEEGAGLTEPAVREHCRGRLAAYKVPRVVRFRKELPKSLIGKVLKREIKRQEEGG